MSPHHRTRCRRFAATLALAALASACPAPEPPGVDAPDVGRADVGAQDAARDARAEADAPDAGAPTTRTCPDGSVVPLSQPCDCPRSLADCDDGDPCTIESYTSSAGGCGTCSVAAVRTCGEVDGCCPAVCAADTDPDCDGCGNGRLEDGEVCDGDCPEDPSDCADAPDACTKATVEGDPSACQSVCRYDAITECADGDGCCAPGCGARTDSDCAPMAVGDACASNPEACSGSSPDLVCLTRDAYPDVPEDGICARKGCDTACPEGEACTRLNGSEFFCIRSCATGCPRADTQCVGILCL